MKTIENKIANDDESKRLIWSKPLVTMISINNVTLGGGATTADSAKAPLTS